MLLKPSNKAKIAPLTTGILILIKLMLSALIKNINY